MREVTLGAVQMERTNDMSKNLEKAIYYIDIAARRGSQAVCLPEAWMSHSPEITREQDEFESFLVEMSDEYMTKIAECAKRNKIYLVAGSVYERDNGKIYNTAPIFEPNGNLLAKVRKVNLENARVKAEIDHNVTPGESNFEVFDTDIGKISVIIDVDMLAIETARILGLKGTEIIFWPVSWPSNARDAIDFHAKMASSCCDGFVVISNPFGEGLYWKRDYYNGGTGIVDLRTIVAQVRDWNEGVAVATVDLDRIETRRAFIREKYPYFRRPETYGLLCDVEAEYKIHRGNPKYEHLYDYLKDK